MPTALATPLSFALGEWYVAGWEFLGHAGHGRWPNACCTCSSLPLYAEPTSRAESRAAGSPNISFELAPFSRTNLIPTAHPGLGYAAVACVAVPDVRS